MIEIYHKENIEKFNTGESQQFATVTFDRGEDARRCKITILIDGIIYTKIGNNKFNPSKRRWSSCVYVVKETGMINYSNESKELKPHEYNTYLSKGETTNVVKICTIQHKGLTLIETHPVTTEELEFLFKRY